jgi:hypothetical protein
MFLGITYLAFDFGIVPGGGETVVSKIARRVFGSSPPYYAVQASTVLILVLAANTSYAGFPRLSSILSRDRFMPRQFGSQGDRLVFSNGILILSGFAIALLVIFGGDTPLLPLCHRRLHAVHALGGRDGRRWLRLRKGGGCASTALEQRDRRRPSTWRSRSSWKVPGGRRRAALQPRGDAPPL